MMWVLVMVAVSVTSWLGVVAMVPELSGEVFFGMCGPLVAVAGTSTLVERTSRVNPAAVAPVMMVAFLVKMVFFGLYVAAVVLWSDVEESGFIVSFTGYFVCLYAAEALLLRQSSGRLT